MYVPEMTYKVSSGTLNLCSLTHSMYVLHSMHPLQNHFGLFLVCHMITFENLHLYFWCVGIVDTSSEVRGH